MNRLAPEDAKINMLGEAVIPPGTEEICRLAFGGNADLFSVSIPASVKRIQKNAFRGCRNLKRVTIAGRDTVIADGAFEGCPPDMELKMKRTYQELEKFHWFGGSLLMPVRTGYPDGGHIRDADFQKYAAKCAGGDADAMWKFAEYFRKRKEEHNFFEAAANLWTYRAAQKGCDDAKKWLDRWMAGKDLRKAWLPSILDDSFSGNVSGMAMYYAGFLFFDRKRLYNIEEADSDGIVTVSSWCESDGPDETGFGREDYYDWWYLDENFKELPGVDVLHSCSCRDRRDNWKWFAGRRAKAAEIVKQRQSRNCFCHEK